MGFAAAEEARRLGGMLILHFDHTSPAAAVAVMRLQRLADEGSAVGFQGFDVLGLEVAIPVTLDQLEEVERHRSSALELGLPMQRPTRRPPTLGAHVVGELAESRGLGASWRLTCLRAYWDGDADLGSTEVLAELAARAGLPTDEVGRVLADRSARTAMRARMIEARSRGIGGVPVLEYAGTLLSADLPDADLRALAAL